MKAKATVDCDGVDGGRTNQRQWHQKEEKQVEIVG